MGEGDVGETERKGWGLGMTKDHGICISCWNPSHRHRSAT